jgi:hypothetical protein
MKVTGCLVGGFGGSGIAVHEGQCSINTSVCQSPATQKII